MIAFKDISIRNKLIIIQLATAFIAVLFCCTIFVVNNIKVLRQTAMANKNSIAEIVGINAAPAIEFNDREAANEMLAKFRSNPSVLNAVIFDKSGNEFARYNKKGEEAFAFSKPGMSEANQQNTFGRRFSVSYAIAGKDFLGTVMLRSEISEYRAIVLSYLKVAFIILLASLLAAFVISTWLQSYITYRLLALVQKTKEVAETGDYSIRASASEMDEIGVLSGGFNNMLGQIEKMNTELSLANIELDNRVKKRTAELEIANKELEIKSEELLRSNRELSQYAYVASHDLQEPLRTITNYVGLLEEKYADQTDEETKVFTRFVVKSANTMKNLISHLLDYSRIGRNVSFVQVDLDKVLKEVIEEMEGTIKETHAKIIAPKLPTLTANTIEMKQLFQNLISNAVKFRKKDNTPVIEITATENAQEWLFSLSDNGIGMDEKNHEKIFIIFQRLHSVSQYPGTGIGLATCKKIISLHNGHLWVESKLGDGSIFYFTIAKNLH